MEEREFEPVAVKGMDKCAVIYRNSAVSFVYVCYHCGAHFADIEPTLQHIESHFQLEEVTIDEKIVKSECNDFDDSSNTILETDNTPDETDSRTDPSTDIKAEIMEIDKDDGGGSVEKPNTFRCECCDSVLSSKFSLRSHLLRDHFKQQTLECEKCGMTFRRDASIKSHLRQHIERGEVKWNCEGDGIREPSSIVVQCPEEQEKSVEKQSVKRQPKKKKTTAAKQQEKAVSHTHMEIQPEKRQPEKRQPKNKNKTTSVKSKKKQRQTPQQSVYICHKCSETYSTLNDLNYHLNTHSTSEMLQINKCKQCNTYFQSAFDLRLHVLQVHLQLKKFQCSTCSAAFTIEEKSLFEKHLELHSANNSANSTNIRHGICDEGKDALNFEEITTSFKLSCEFCEEKFYLKSNLREHVRCIHSDTEHKLRCPQCEAVFAKSNYFFAHQLEHRRVGATITETDQNVLITNLNSYINEQYACNAEENASNPYKCLICYTEKNNLLEMRQHVRLRHVYKTLPQPNKIKQQERIICNVCDKPITRSSLRSHLMTHDEDKQKFPCSFCGRVFSKKYSKTTHERMHTGEKPFQCDQCGKRFFSSSLLGAHKQSHDNTTYPCKICGRVFNIPSGYRRHIQTHRKDQSFECTICSKSFSTRVYLKRHMNKHNEKNIQCSFCDSKFNTAKGKRQHEKGIHHHEPPI